MIDGMTLYTLIHVAISLIGIVSGVTLMYGFLTSRRIDRGTSIFLTSTILTSVTGFGFPIERITPAHILGVLSLLLLGVAVFGYRVRKLQGKWLRLFVITSSIALYLNAFVLVVQLFLKMPFLRAVAPTRTSPAFVVVQSALLIGFVLLTVLALRRLRPAI